MEELNEEINTDRKKSESSDEICDNSESNQSSFI